MVNQVATTLTAPRKEDPVFVDRVLYCTVNELRQPFRFLPQIREAVISVLGALVHYPDWLAVDRGLNDTDYCLLAKHNDIKYNSGQEERPCPEEPRLLLVVLISERN